jgi:hypothetical protein
LSIVLVVIGLIVGGILYGVDLERAAAVRAQITQVEQFNTATNTFQLKYNALPGDLNAASAAQFGFVPRLGIQGRGDGDGLIEGYRYDINTERGPVQSGETLFFWEDLSAANMIDGTFNTATDAEVTGVSNISPYLPAAKIGGGNYVYVWTGGPYDSDAAIGTIGFNYFSISVPSGISDAVLSSSPGLTVAQAYSIDLKIDDGSPNTGLVQAKYVNGWGGTTNNGTTWAPYPLPLGTSNCFNTTSGGSASGCCAAG